MDTSTLAWDSYKETLFKRYNHERKPFQVLFELTPLCNFSCNMCYVHLTREQMGNRSLLSASKWIGFAEQLRDMGTLCVILTGGEAILHPEFGEIYDCLVRMGFLIGLRSNGYLLGEPMISSLEGRKPHLIMITLYGASDETYKRVCGISDGFTVVSKNIEKLARKGFNVQLSMTVTHDNEGDVDKVDAWAADHGWIVKKTWALFRPFENTQRTVSSLWARQSERSDSEPCEVERKGDTESMLEGVKRNAFAICKYHYAQCTITWDGRMTPCTGVPYLFTEPERSGVNAAYTLLNEIKDGIEKPEECMRCNYREYCFTCPSFFIQPDGKPKIDRECCKRAMYRYELVNGEKME